MTTAISVPLDFPKIIPNDWDEWFRVWERNKKIVPKIQTTKNLGKVIWRGFDIYVKDNIDADDITKYHCENINCPELFNSLFDNLDKFPMDLYLVRVLESTHPVSPHHDYATDSKFHSIRSLLYSNSQCPTWYYQQDNKEKQYLKLPDETNTWYYNDLVTKHGTDLKPNYTKQLIMYRGAIKENQLDTLLEKSITKYKDYCLFS